MHKLGKLNYRAYLETAHNAGCMHSLGLGTVTSAQHGLRVYFSHSSALCAIFFFLDKPLSPRAAWMPPSYNVVAPSTQVWNAMPFTFSKLALWSDEVAHGSNAVTKPKACAVVFGSLCLTNCFMFLCTACGPP